MSQAKINQTEKEWVYLEHKNKFKSDKYNQIILDLLSLRGIENEKESEIFLSPEYESLKDPHLIPDIEKAVSVIEAAVKNDEKITIYGDYDVDGISSTALLVDFFRKIGHKAEYYIPSRHEEGYGLNKEAIKEISNRKSNLIITVDCGSTSLDEIQYAKEIGLKVVVTDHHNLKNEDGKDIMPAADAIVNPKRSDSKLNDELAGVGVVFYLVRALQERFLDKLPKGNEKWFLDLVALGTICDVVPLIGENRILTKFGLKVLSKSKRVGIKELVAVSNFNLKDIEAYHVGFLLGPRLNAAGRLETAHEALELLITDDQIKAQGIASDLNILNKKRQELTLEIIEEAKKVIKGIKDNRKIYLLKNQNWPSGIVGIVASRLVEEFNRPVLVMEEMEDILKGSARSIPGFNITEALGECKDELIQYGGHAYAAGFKLNKEQFAVMEDKLINICESKIELKDLIPKIYIDRVVRLNEIDKELIDDIKLLEPFGNSNYKPTFSLEKVKIDSIRFLGSEGQHLKMVIRDGEYLMSGMYFNYDKYIGLKVGDNINIALYFDENVWNGKSAIEFKTIDVKLNK